MIQHFDQGRLAKSSLKTILDGILGISHIRFSLKFRYQKKKSRKEIINLLRQFKFSMWKFSTSL